MKEERTEENHVGLSYPETTSEMEIQLQEAHWDGSQQYQAGSERTKSEDRQKVNCNAQPPGDAHWAGIGTMAMPAR